MKLQTLEMKWMKNALVIYLTIASLIPNHEERNRVVRALFDKMTDLARLLSKQLVTFSLIIPNYDLDIKKPHHVAIGSNHFLKTLKADYFDKSDINDFYMKVIKLDQFYI